MANRLVGCRIVSDPHVPLGTVVFKDRNGKELARIENVGGPVDKTRHYCKDCFYYDIYVTFPFREAEVICKYRQKIYNKFNGEILERVSGVIGWNKNGNCPKFIKKKPPLSERISRWFKGLRNPG
jgi:hypothetical protein